MTFRESQYDDYHYDEAKKHKIQLYNRDLGAAIICGLLHFIRSAIMSKLA